MKLQGQVVAGMILLGACGVGACEKGSSLPLAQKKLVATADGLPSDDRWRQDFAFADMDGDGRLDIVTAPPRKGKEPWPHIFLSRGDRWEPVSCPNVGQNGFPQQEYAYGG